MDHLTTPNAELAEFQRKTPSGMAHWAGTGPDGATCLQCKHWNNCGDPAGYYSKTGMRGGMIKPRRCGKYKSMMQGRHGDAIPWDALACKYFDKNETPPPLSAK